MPTIEQLNFDLLIDDKQFNAQVQKALKDAKDLNTQLSTLLNLRKQFAGSAKNAAQDEKDLSRAIEEQTRKMKDNTNAVRAGAAAAKAFNAERYKMKGFNLAGSLSGSASSLSELTSLATQYVSILGGAKLVKAITQVTAEFELQRITLRAILQDVEGADAIFRSIKQLAVVSPFSFKELVTYAKQLSAYSIPMNELYETTKMLADVSAGLGVGMDRLVLAYGQIRSASFLRGQEVRQLTEAGIPILEELRKQFVELGEEGITVGDVFDKISNRMVPFEMVSKVFRNMTSEGGKFYKMQEVQAETLRGKISNLKDAYDIMFDKIGNKNMDTLKGAVDWVRSLAENYQKTTRILAELVIGYGTYRAALVLASAVEKSIITVNTIRHLSEVISKMNALKGATAALGAAVKTLGATKALSAGAGILGILALITTAIVKAVQNAKELDKTLGKLTNEKYNGASKLASDFDILVKKLEGAKRGSQEYRDAIAELNRKYGEYMPKLATEIDSLDVLRGKINGVTDAIYNRAKAYAYEAGVQAIEEKNNKDIENPLNQVTGWLRGMDVDDSAITAFLQKFRDAVIKGLGDRSAQEAFDELVLSFFGSDSRVYKSASQIDVLGVNNLAKAYTNAEQRVKDFKATLDARFDKSQYDSAEEMKRVQAINERYDGLASAIKKASFSVEEYDEAIKKIEIGRLTQLAKTYDELGRPEKAAEARKKIEELQKVVTGWRAVVNELVGTKGNSDLLAQEDQNINEYIDGLQKEYKNLAEQYKQASAIAESLKNNVNSNPLITEKDVKIQQDYADKLKKRKEIIEAIAKALPFSLETSTSKGASGKSPEQLELETRINTLKTVYEWYQKLEKLKLDSNTIKSSLTSFFPEQSSIIEMASYKDELLKLADELAKYDQKAAQSLRDYVSGRSLNTVYDKFNEQYQQSIEFQKRLNGYLEDAKTIEQKISDLERQRAEDLAKVNANTAEAAAINKHYNDEIDKLNDSMLELTQISLTEFWQQLTGDNSFASYKYLNELQNKAIELRDTLENIAPNKNKSGKIVGFTITREKNAGLLDSLDISKDEVTLTVEQIKQLNNVIDELYGKKAEKNSFATFISSIKDAGGLKEFVAAMKRGNAEGKKYREVMKAAMNDTARIGDIFTELGDATGSGFLTSMGSTLSAAGDILGKLAEGDIIGAIGAVISSLTSWITASIQLKKNIAEAADEAERARLALTLEDGTETIFGANALRAITNASAALREYGRLTKENVQNLSDKSINWSAGLFKWGTKSKSLKDAVDELGYDLYDKYGNLNADALQAILDTYTDLKKADREWIKEAIKNSELYTQAMEQLEESLSSIYGNMLDNIADSLVESWKQAGNAALDYASILDDVATSYAKMILKNAIIDKVFTPQVEEEIKRLSKLGDTDAAIALLEQKLNQVSLAEGEWAQIMARFDKYFGQSESSNTVASGITSITEDTANLLASYINAMRSDLAGHRFEVQGIGADIKILLGLMPSTPTLAEYLTQIQANTYNTSVKTSEIMDFLYSVGGDGASSYIRIQ